MRTKNQYIRLYLLDLLRVKIEIALKLVLQRITVYIRLVNSISDVKNIRLMFSPK